jgi:hypothetical protein
VATTLKMQGILMLQLRYLPAPAGNLKVNMQEKLGKLASEKQVGLQKEKQLFLEWYVCKDSKKASEIYSEYLAQVRKNNAAGIRSRPSAGQANLQTSE